MMGSWVGVYRIDNRQPPLAVSGIPIGLTRGAAAAVS